MELKSKENLEKLQYEEELYKGFYEENSRFFFSDWLKKYIREEKLNEIINSNLPFYVKGAIFHHLWKYYSIFENNDHKVFEMLKNKEFSSIVDIGANFGDFGIITEDLCDKQYLVDMVKETIEIQKLFTSKEKAQLFNLAISDSIKTDFMNIEIDTLRSYLDSGAFNFDKPEDNRIAEKREIQTISLDNFIFENNIKPDLIKIDVEGSEENVIKGANKTIDKFHPYFIIFLHEKKDDACNKFKYLFKNKYNVDFYKIEINERFWKYIICSPKNII